MLLKYPAIKILLTLYATSLGYYNKAVSDVTSVRVLHIETLSVTAWEILRMLTNYFSILYKF